MNKAELKVQALREAMRDRVANITVEYEERVADLRIELTEVSHQNGELARQNEELLAENDRLKQQIAERDEHALERSEND